MAIPPTPPTPSVAPVEQPSRRDFFRRAAGAGGRPDGAAHIASFVAHLRPQHMAEFVRAVNARPGLEVAWQDPKGKVVVLADARETDALSQANRFLEQLPGVVAVGMAAHYLDDDNDVDNDQVDNARVDRGARSVAEQS